jgi:hypothetical protein
MEKPYFERLSEKSKAIKQCLPFPKNDWSNTVQITKKFGLRVKWWLVLSMSIRLISQLLEKKHSPAWTSALFYGQAGILEESIENAYYQNLHKNIDSKAEIWVALICT